MIMPNLFGCTSVEDVNIPENGGSDFFKPNEGTTKIRFLAGPLVYFESQEFDEDTRKPVGERRFYMEGDEAIKKDKHAKLTFTYMIFDYTDKTVKQWNIATKGLLKTIKELNSLNPDLSAMDCNLTKKKGSNGYMQYGLISGQNSEFNNAEVIELFTNDNPFDKVSDLIAKKIDETIDAGESLDFQESEIAKEISDNKAPKPSKPSSEEEAGEIFNNDEPASTTKARENAKSETPKEEDPFEES